MKKAEAGTASDESGYKARGEMKKNKMILGEKWKMREE